MTTKASCPFCGGDMKYQSWQDEVWGAMTTVETHYECRYCSFEAGSSYGNNYQTLFGIELVPDMDHWDWILVEVFYEQRTGERLDLDRAYELEDQ